MGKKDVLLLTNSMVTNTLSSCSQSVAQGDDERLASIASVLAGLLKHYEKKVVGGGLSGFLGVGRRIMGRVLDAGVGGEESNEFMAATCGEMGRVFGGLGAHKDAIKKNVIPLILDYVAAWNTMSTSVKRNLDVFPLLSMCSKFEQQQLLCYAEGLGLKGAWREVWGVYQSNVYKGQF